MFPFLIQLIYDFFLPYSRWYQRQVNWLFPFFLLLLFFSSILLPFPFLFLSLYHVRNLRIYSFHYYQFQFLKITHIQFSFPLCPNHHISLNETNFLRWSQYVWMYIRGRGKIGYLTCDTKEPTNTDCSFATQDAENSMIMA